MTRSRVLLSVLVSGVACLLVIPFAQRVVPSTADDPPATARVCALAVLRDWDRSRAAAWRAGEPAALVGLYTSEAEAGRADRRLLASYAARGLHVRGMLMQVAEVEVLEAGEERIELVVTDRLVGAVAVRGRTRIDLPRDGWSRRRMVLVKGGDRWRVTEVRDQPRPENTDAASRSANS